MSVTSRRWVYVDTSAFVKLCWNEQESEALRAHLGGRPIISSVVLHVETLRAALRRSPADVAIAQQRLRRVSRLDIAGATISVASTLLPPEVRSLDAIHIAAAKLLDSDLDELITYDDRMRQAAIAQGLSVSSPN